VQSVLIVLAKAPVPGRVKTRLCPPAPAGAAAAWPPRRSPTPSAAALRVPAAEVVVALDGEPDPTLAVRLGGHHGHTRNAAARRANGSRRRTPTWPRSRRVPAPR
jgi:hypothetical protein